MDLVLGPSPFSLGRDPSRRRPFPSVSPLERLVHTCAWEFWATLRSGCGRLTGTLSSVFCLGMWVPAGQAIGESGAHRRPVVLCALGCWCREETVDRIGPGSGLCQAALPALTYLLSVAGGYGPPPAGRGAPPPPPPFTSYIVSTPPGGFPPPQGFPQGYGAPPQFSECYPSRTEAACQLSAILLG